MSLLNKINQGIEYLPKKDATIAKELLQKRDFEELIYLIESSLYKINQNLESNHPKDEYLDIDLEKLEYLLDNVNDYYSEIEGNSFQNTYTEKLDEEIEDDIFESLISDEWYD